MALRDKTKNRSRTQNFNKKYTFEKRKALIRLVLEQKYSIQKAGHYLGFTCSTAKRIVSDFRIYGKITKFKHQKQDQSKIANSIVSRIKEKEKAQIRENLNLQNQGENRGEIQLYQAAREVQERVQECNQNYFNSENQLYYFFNYGLQFPVSHLPNLFFIFYYI